MHHPRHRNGTTDQLREARLEGQNLPKRPQDNVH
jgi:hypothetical protein